MQLMKEEKGNKEEIQKYFSDDTSDTKEFRKIFCDHQHQYSV
jgi:hypothetical protein